MCYTGVMLNPQGRRMPKSVYRKLINEMKANPHGFYLYSTKPPTRVRTIIYGEAVSTLKALRTAENLHFHFRLATSGLIDDVNVHGWKVGDYYITHNGIVLCYMSSVELSDTLKMIKDEVFTENLVKEEWVGLYNHIVRCGFTGTLFIVKHDFSNIVAINTGTYGVYYYNINGIVFATSRPLGRKFHGKLYRNGVFKISYDGVTTLHKEPYVEDYSNDIWRLLGVSFLNLKQ